MYKQLFYFTTTNQCSIYKKIKKS